MTLSICPTCVSDRAAVLWCTEGFYSEGSHRFSRLTNQLWIKAALAAPAPPCKPQSPQAEPAARTQHQTPISQMESRELQSLCWIKTKRLLARAEQQGEKRERLIATWSNRRSYHTHRRRRWPV